MPPDDDTTSGTDGDRPEPVGWMRSMVIDARHPVALASFWCDVLGVEVVESESDWVQLSPDPGGAFLAFQPSDAPRPNALVVRPDIEVDDIDAARTQIESYGGSYVRTIHEMKGDDHYVMADPEGNEFCLVQPLPPELRRERWGDRPS